MLDVHAKDMFELSAARDQEPLETVTADRADPAFGEGVRVRRAERGTDDLDAHASVDIVEGTSELAVAIMDQKPDRVGCRNSSRVPIRPICSGIAFMHPTASSSSSIHIPCA
jgi:hypothetical protein